MAFSVSVNVPIWLNLINIAFIIRIVNENKFYIVKSLKELPASGEKFENVCSEVVKIARRRREFFGIAYYILAIFPLHIMPAHSGFLLWILIQ